MLENKALTSLQPLLRILQKTYAHVYKWLLTVAIKKIYELKYKLSSMHKSSDGEYMSEQWLKEKSRSNGES